MIAIPVIMAIKMTCTPTFAAATPKRVVKPALTCCAPKPKEVAKPKIVAKTAIISIKCPQNP